MTENIEETAMSEDKPFHKGKKVTVTQFDKHGFTEMPRVNGHVGTRVSYRNNQTLGAPVVSFMNENRDIYQAIALKDPLAGQFEIISYKPHNL